MPQPGLAKDFRQRFAAAAWKLGCAHGASAVTVRALAEDLGVSAALLYAHFDDKASLLDEVQRFVQPMLISALAEASHRVDGDGRLFHMCLAYVEFMREHGWVYSVVPSKVGTVASSRGHQTAFVEHACPLLATENDASPATRALHLWVGVHGLALVSSSRPRSELPTKDEDGFIREHLLGLCGTRGAIAWAS